ncbi:MAG: LPS export ABC transporter periplasmic protein LptC [Desulfobacterales bacterium]|nr:LPS export ABC transporter periplasmic protein LptC [Desulfobacterales bacterium]
MNEARLTNAVIDIYGKKRHTTDRSQPDNRRLRVMTFDHIFSREALPAFPVKRISSIVIEPVLVKLHDQRSVLTEISAASATIRLKKRDILFKENVRVASGSRILTTDRLSLSPENAVMKTDKFVLRTPEKQFKGERLTNGYISDVQGPIKEVNSRRWKGLKIALARSLAARPRVCFKLFSSILFTARLRRVNSA